MDTLSKVIIGVVSVLALYAIIHFKIVSKRKKTTKEKTKPVKRKEVITVWDIWEDL